jgi:hypothetical protein
MHITDKVFLQQLKDEMINGEHDYQASPRFWVIMDYRDEVTAEGFHDNIELYDSSACHVFKTVDDYILDVEERVEYGFFFDTFVPKIKQCIEMARDKHFGSYEMDELLEETGDKSDMNIVYTKRESYIVPNTFFLTKKEAEDYLEMYGYNHTDKAHTYAMTALRSPNYNRLIKFIENIEEW